MGGKLELQEKIGDILQWASCLTAEHFQDDEQLWTKQMDGLKRRLKITHGNLIAILGIQGVGKTKLSYSLKIELDEDIEKDVRLVKWDGKKSIREILAPHIEAEYLFNLIQEYDRLAISYVSNFLDIKNESFLQDALQHHNLLKMKDAEAKICDSIRQKIRGKNYSGAQENKEIQDGLKHLIKIEFTKKLEGFLSKKTAISIKDNIFSENLENIHTILIDTPDYNRKSTSSFSADLKELEKFWLSILQLGDVEEGQQVNLIMFFQKELWDLRPSFFCGKFNEITLKPLTPKQLMEYYETTFGGCFPFSEDALKELAILSRGIFRRFKRYIGLCIEQIGDLESSLESSDVDTIINLDVLVKDFEQELKNVFPRNKALHRKTVILLQLLSAKPLTQKEIGEKFFDGNKMGCSRFLNSLECWGYIERHYENREKTVSLKET